MSAPAQRAPGRRRHPPRVGRHALALSFAALVLPLSLVACGSDSDDGDDIASDPAPTSPSDSPGPSDSPTAAPTVGTYPEFGPTDYTYTLTYTCFCLGAGVPVEVTVEDGKAVGATYVAEGGDRGGVKPGDPVPETFWLTINDIIEKANDTQAARVDVDWPEGQDYPNNVYVDGSEKIADDENGFTIADVQVTEG